MILIGMLRIMIAHAHEPKSTMNVAQLSTLLGVLLAQLAAMETGHTFSCMETAMEILNLQIGLSGELLPRTIREPTCHVKSWGEFMRSKIMAITFRAVEVALAQQKSDHVRLGDVRATENLAIELDHVAFSLRLLCDETRTILTSCMVALACEFSESSVPVFHNAINGCTTRLYDLPIVDDLHKAPTHCQPRVA